MTGESVATCRAILNEFIEKLFNITASIEIDGQTVVERLIGNASNDQPAQLTIEPVAVQAEDGKLVVKFPSKIDLRFDRFNVVQV